MFDVRFAITTSIVALAVLVAAAPEPARRRTGLAIPVTKRSSLVNADTTVNVEALNAHVASVKAKILRGLDNYERNTGAPHPSALHGNQRRDTGAISLTNDNSHLWYGEISVGSSPSTFIVDFDTGSSDLFLPGPSCTEDCTGHTTYDPSSSTTSVDLGRTADIKYGDNSTVSVEQYTDTVIVAGLTATDQTLGAATKYSSGLAKDNFPPDGLMGMAFQSISVYSASPVFQTLISEGQVDEPVFSFKLASSGSELFLGGANSELYAGQFTYTPVTQEGFWEVNIDSIQGNGQTPLTNINSIIDTGTTLIVGNPSQVSQLYAALGGTDASKTAGPGYYTFPCNRFPSISFTFGGTSFAISNEYLNLGAVSSGSSDCVSGIIGQDTDSSSWVVGGVFLENVYTTFDVGNSQVGFAQLA